MEGIFHILQAGLKDEEAHKPQLTIEGPPHESILPLFPSPKSLGPEASLVFVLERGRHPPSRSSRTAATPVGWRYRRRGKRAAAAADPDTARRQFALGGGGTGCPKTTGVGSSPTARRPSRYESQKRRDWQIFTRYLGARRPPLQPLRCSPAHVLEFLRYLDRFGKTRVHAPPCAAYGAGAGAGLPFSAEACQCPRRQAWGSLDALVGRLRAAFAEHHGARGSRTAQQSGGASDSTNPFAARDVTLYLRDVHDAQSRASGISYNRKKKQNRQQDGAD